MEETSWRMPQRRVYRYVKEGVQAEFARLSIVLVCPKLKLSLLSSESGSKTGCVMSEADGSANGIGDPEELKGE